MSKRREQCALCTVERVPGAVELSVRPDRAFSPEGGAHGRRGALQLMLAQILDTDSVLFGDPQLPKSTIFWPILKD